MDACNMQEDEQILRTIQDVKCLIPVDKENILH